MPFTLIKGTFHVKGYSPDGDSLKFHANKELNWKKLAGPKAKRNAKKHVQLRFEGIDTPETHYKNRHQPRKQADAATDFAMAAAGITNVQWGPTRGRVVSANDGTPGYILSRATEKYGRPVSFVFAGKTNKPDGSAVHLDIALLKKSINYKLLQAGWAYSTYYTGLFYDLRDTMTSAVSQARKRNRGVWPQDRTSGVSVKGIQSIEARFCVMPKLFRRLVDYLERNNDNVKGFKKHLEKNQEGVLLLRTNHFTHFDTVVKEKGRRIGLTELPEDLVFHP